MFVADCEPNSSNVLFLLEPLDEFVQIKPSSVFSKSLLSPEELLEAYLNNPKAIVALGIRSHASSLSVDVVRENVELLYELGSRAFKSDRSELYDLCVTTLFHIGKAFPPLFLEPGGVKDMSLNETLHTRLHIWTSLHRLTNIHKFSFRSLSKTPVKAVTFVTELTTLQICNLLHLAEILQDPICCSCISVAWRSLYECEPNVSQKLVEILQSRPVKDSLTFEHDFFFFARDYASRISAEGTLAVFYRLYPYCFDKSQGSRFLTFVHSKIPGLPSADCLRRLWKFLATTRLMVPLLNNFISSLIGRLPPNPSRIFPDDMTALKSTVRRFDSIVDVFDDSWTAVFKILVLCFSENGDLWSDASNWLNRLFAATTDDNAMANYCLIQCIALQLLGPAIVTFSPPTVERPTLYSVVIFSSLFFISKSPVTMWNDHIIRIKKLLIDVPSTFHLPFVEALRDLNTECTDTAGHSQIQTLVSRAFFDGLTLAEKKVLLVAFKSFQDVPAHYFTCLSPMPVLSIISFMGHQVSRSRIPNSVDFLTLDPNPVAYVMNVLETCRTEGRPVLSENRPMVCQMFLLHLLTTESHDQQFCDFYVRLLATWLGRPFQSFSSNTDVVSWVCMTTCSKSEVAQHVFTARVFHALHNALNGSFCTAPIEYVLTQVVEVLKSNVLTVFDTGASQNEQPQVLALKYVVEKYLVAKDLSDTDLHLKLMRSLTEMRFHARISKLYADKMRKNIDSKIDALDF